MRVFVFLLWAFFLLLLNFFCPAHADGTKIRVALFIDDGTEASEFRKEFRRNTDNEISWQKIDGDDLKELKKECWTISMRW